MLRRTDRSKEPAVQRNIQMVLNTIAWGEMEIPLGFVMA